MGGAEAQAGRPPGITAEEVAEDVFLEVLGDAVRAVEGAGIPYVLMGGFASAALGRDRWTHDIDFFVKPDDAEKILEVLAARDFATQKIDPAWLYKAYKSGVLVDVIFCSADDIYLDSQMLERAQNIEFKGERFRVIPPEDLLIIKARVFKEETPRHWFDALGIVRAASLDWDYLVSKAKEKPDKVLSVLLYAKASGMDVPGHVIQRLAEVIAKRREPPKSAPTEEADDYVAARIHERLAQEGLEVDVYIEDGAVIVTGDATTGERWEMISQLAGEMGGGRPIVNHSTVADYRETEEMERLP